MSSECDECGEHCLECRCYSTDALIPLSNDSINPPPEIPETKWINVRGREEHEAILRDIDKMWSLGLNPTYEKMVYLRRWGSWLNGSVSYDGKVKPLES
jgi:hypothetical protein